MRAINRFLLMTVVTTLLVLAALPVAALQAALASAPDMPEASPGLPAVSPGICVDLPPSRLLVYSIKPARLEEETVPAASLNRRPYQGVPADALAAKHPLMLSVHNLVSIFNIQHRPVARGDGWVCDAPAIVRIGFGASRRQLFVAASAAGDGCVRRELLDHEAAHMRAFEETVDHFIDDREPNFEKGMKALKETPAPNQKMGAMRWNEGIRLITHEAKRQLMNDLRAADSAVDAPAALAVMAAACDGRVKELERRGLSKTPGAPA
jgi:hypothetical protein